MGAAAVDDGHVAEHTAVGLFVADAGDEAVPFLPMAFTVDESGKAPRRPPLSGRHVYPVFASVAAGEQFRGEIAGDPEPFRRVAVVELEDGSAALGLNGDAIPVETVLPWWRSHPLGETTLAWHIELTP